MTQHHNECPKEIVSCHHSSIGCNTRINRDELLSHDKECMSSHLDLAIKEMHELRQEIHELRQEIHELRQDQKCMSSHLDSVVKKLGFDIRMLKAQTFKIPVIKMQNYSQNKEEWISPGFYVSTGSYKMALKVSEHKGQCMQQKMFTIHFSTYPDYGISCELALLLGEYDDTLEWPFQGDVTVELLNQMEDKDHKKIIINFNKDTPDECKNRVILPKVNGEWWGDKIVVPDLSPMGPQYCCSSYMSNDTLYFRVSVVINSKTKPWLI